MIKEKHVHKYQKIEFGRSKHLIFKCQLPGCTHYMPHIELAENKLSMCWGDCGNAVLMTKEILNTVKPMCDSCKESIKVAKAIKSLQRDLA